MGNYNYSQPTMDDLVFDFIYGCSLRDAILQKSFVGKRTWIGKDVPEAQACVKRYIDRVLKGDFKRDDEVDKKLHDKVFLQTAIEVCQVINNSPKKPSTAGKFTFGNAQKLMNMTVKHVYAHTYSIHTVGYASIREHFRYCHCPMDQKMMKKVWESFAQNKQEDELGYKSQNSFCKSWGSEDFDVDKGGKEILPDRYVSFQNAIKKIISKAGGDVFPIEYDYLVWKSSKPISIVNPRNNMES